MAKIYGEPYGETISGSSQKDYLFGDAGDDTIYGNAGNDTIDGGDDNDVIYGGKGNDTLTGGNGDDIFVYANGDGNDVITDYIAGEDKIHFTSGTPKFKVNGNDVVITVGSGKITVKGAADRVITYIDSKGNEKTWPNTIDINEDTNTVKLASGYARDSFNLAGYDDDLQTVDASAVAHDLEITGNSKANRIIGSEEDDVIDGGAGKDTLLGGDGNDSLNGGKGNDSLYGGDGNDMLTGGAGSDIFVYAGDGNDVITDYAEEDKIRFTTGTKDDLDIFTNGNDAVLQFDSNNKVTVKDAAGKTITYIIGGKTYTTLLGEAVKYNTKGTAATLTSNYNDDEFKASASKYPGTLKNIDASAVDHDIAITGNKLANSIIGSKQDDTIDGGKSADTIDGGDGNDIIYGGAGNDILFGGAGADTFVFKSGEGNDVISDYNAEEDIVSISSGSVEEADIKGGDLIYKIGTGKLTVKGAAGKNVHFIGSDGKHFYLPDRPINELEIATNGKGATLTESFSADELNANTHAELKNFANNLVTLDASAASHGISITGTKNKNYIIGGDDDDTIIGGKGADTLKGGEGSDVFVFASGDGNNKILDYNEEDDIIKFTSGTPKFKKSGNNVIITLGSSSKISVMGAADKIISYIDKDGQELTYPKDVLKVSGTKVTLLENYNSSSFNVTTNQQVSEQKDKIKTIDASAVQQDIEIVGNKLNNKITGSAEDDTIYGGAGNDTLDGGDGQDVFVYNNGDGKDVIVNYTSGEDVISIMSGVSVTDVGKSGDNVVFKVGKGTITVKNVKDQVVSYVENGEEKTYPVVKPYTVSGTSVTLSESYTTYYGKTFDVTAQEDTKNVISINAKNVDDDLVVKGNNKNNTIYCSGGDNTIYGGKGNDTINGGEGKNLYVYNNGDGNDLIYSWGTGDSISVASGSVGDITFKNSTAILPIGKGKVSLRGVAENTEIAYRDEDGWHTIILGAANSADNVLEDDNFITANNDLSAIVESKAVDYAFAQAGNVTSLTKSSNALPALSPSKKK